MHCAHTQKLLSIHCAHTQKLLSIHCAHTQMLLSIHRSQTQKLLSIHRAHTQKLLSTHCAHTQMLLSSSAITPVHVGTFGSFIEASSIVDSRASSTCNSTHTSPKKPANSPKAPAKSSKDSKKKVNTVSFPSKDIKKKVNTLSFPAGHALCLLVPLFANFLVLHMSAFWSFECLVSRVLEDCLFDVLYVNHICDVYKHQTVQPA
jgi:hypothetical protein